MAVSERPVVAVVLAAGVGARVGADRPKQLLDLGDRNFVEWCVSAFLGHPRVDEVLVMAHPDWIGLIEAYAEPDARTLPGGVYRHDSVRLALAAIDHDDADVLIHDAARPLVSDDVIDRCLDALESHRAAGPYIESADTLVRVEGDRVAEVLDRATIRRAQTPQAFRLGVIRAAHEAAAADPDHLPTDDCGVVARYLPDEPIAVVAGDPRNIKITEPSDLAVAEALLGESR